MILDKSYRGWWQQRDLMDRYPVDVFLWEEIRRHSCETQRGAYWNSGGMIWSLVKGLFGNYQLALGGPGEAA